MSNRKPFADLTRAFTAKRRLAVEVRKSQLREQTSLSQS